MQLNGPAMVSDDEPWEGVKPFKDSYPYKEGHIYIVEVAWRSSNPVHRAILHVGFLNKDGNFGSYCEVWCNSYEEFEYAGNAYYLKVIKDLGPLEDEEVECVV